MGGSAERRHTSLDVVVEALRLTEALRQREDHVCRFGSKDLPDLRGARLHDHGMTLRRTRNVQRTLDREILGFVIKDMKLVGVKVTSCRSVAYKRIIIPTIPQATHN